MSYAVLLALFLALCLGCGSMKGPPPLPPKIAKAPAEPWSVTCLDPNDPTPALLWNGLIGVRIGRDGTPSGQPLFTIDSYEEDGEEKIVPFDPLLEPTFLVSEQALDPTNAKSYTQTLDFATGIIRTEWTEDTASGEVRISVDAACSRERPEFGFRVRINAPRGVQIQIYAHPDSMLPSETVSKKVGSRWAIVQPFDLQNDRPMSRITFLSDGKALAGSDLPFEWRYRQESGQSVFEALVSLGVQTGPFGKWPEAGRTLEGFDALTRSGTWSPNECDIEIDGPVEDQQAVRSFLYYLRTAIHPEGQMSIAPMGLSSTVYNGHVFWDADIWVAPALWFVYPEGAKAIADYRLRMANQAFDNFRRWKQAGRPTGGNALGKVEVGELPYALKYPWESSVSGKETVPGPSQFQDHISGSVAFSLDRAAALGSVDPKQAKKIVQGVGGFYRHRISGGGGDIGWNLTGAMSPDEHHVGDNDLYTNLLAQWCLTGGTLNRQSSIVNRQSGDLHPPTPSSSGAGGAGVPQLNLPRDDKSFLTYDGDPVRSYKQAAAVLAIYPLQYPEAEKQAKVMMERFADKVTKNGPAMSDSVHALIWARLGEKEKAYETWRKSWMDFTHGPLLQFSEKRSSNRRSSIVNRQSGGTSTPGPSSLKGGGGRTYFTTGAAGCLQAVIYGFLGFRIDDKAQPGAAWSTPLKNGKVLSIKPNLPREWRKVTFKNFKVLGRSYTLVATHEGAKITSTPRGSQRKTP